MRRGRAFAAAAAALPAASNGTDALARTGPSTAVLPALAATSGAAPPVTASISVGCSSDVLSAEATATGTADVERPAPKKRRRIPVQRAPSAMAAQELEPSASRHADAGSLPVVPLQQPVAMPSLLELVERFKNVFLSAEDGPVATAGGGLADKATYELVLAVRDAIDDLWESHEAEIKHRCAPAMPLGLIAKQEVFGFALADALGRPVLPGDRAMKVGQSGDNAVRAAEGSKDRKGKVTAARDAAVAAVRRARRAADKDATLEQGVAQAEEKGRKHVEDVLRTPVDLKLPNETIGAKRKSTVASDASPASSTAAQTLADRQQGVQEAQAAFDAAEEVRRTSRARATSLQRKHDELGPWPIRDNWYDAWESKHPAHEQKGYDFVAYCDRTFDAFRAAEAPFVAARDAMWKAELAALESVRAATLALGDLEEAQALCRYAEEDLQEEEDAALMAQIWQRLSRGEAHAEEAPWAE
jgi:hypothetical protein